MEKKIITPNSEKNSFLEKSYCTCWYTNCGLKCSTDLQTFYLVGEFFFCWRNHKQSKWQLLRTQSYTTLQCWKVLKWFSRLSCRATCILDGAWIMGWHTCIQMFADCMYAQSQSPRSSWSYRDIWKALPPRNCTQLDKGRKHRLPPLILIRNEHSQVTSHKEVQCM